MNKELFKINSILLTDPEYGTEPSLYDIITHYYTSYDLSEEVAIGFTEIYINKFLKEIQNEK